MVLCKVWGLGMFSIVALTTSNIFLTLRLIQVTNDGSCYQNTPYRVFPESSYPQNRSAYTQFVQFPEHSPRSSSNSSDSRWAHFVEIDSSLGRFDDRRLFKVFDNAYVGPDYVTHSQGSVVTLATQSSADRLFWLTQVARYWEDAPISLAIFVPDIEFGIVKLYMQYLMICFPYVGKKMAVHLVFPHRHPPKPIQVALHDLLQSCHQPTETLKKLLSLRPKSMMKWRETMRYPQNLLRNVARKNSQTEWHFLTDVDIIPVPKMAGRLSIFLQSSEAVSCPKCAFVVPTYEISEKASLPHSRSLLLNLTKMGLARPFHQKVFIYNQHATNFSRWESRELDYPGETQVTISHRVTRFEFFYEPFYISKDNVPPHDERFLGYGFTRNTQVYEMYVAGYTFKVVSPIFTIHWGMQEKKGRPVWRERQNNLNRKHFESFKREVYARYQKDPLGMMITRNNKRNF